jgi:hypothetical protein
MITFIGGLDTVSATTIAKFAWPAGLAAHNSSSRPGTTRNTSMLRGLTPRARGWREIEARFSTSRLGTPRQARSRAALSPASPAPTMRTGKRRRFGMYSPSYIP